MEMQNGTASVEDCWAISYKTENTLVLFSDHHFGVFPKELETSVHTETSTWMFLAALLILAKIWKEAICPLECKWIFKN